MPTQRKRSWFMPGAIAVLALFIGGCGRQEAVATTPPRQEAPNASAERLDPAKVEQWADRVFGKILAEHRVSALAITVTQGDQLVLTKGYGYADWGTRAPVVPDHTQFRIASLTKTFVATAVAQLVERGRIDSLDDPANKYLKRVQLPQSSGEDITIWDLLTHRAGFGGVSIDTGEDELPTAAPLPGNLIARYIPPYVRERDALSVYCNFCFAMLGFMVEDISGQTLQDYLQQNIFAPLGMTHTVLSNALEAPPDVATQYAFMPDKPPVPLPYPTISPLLSYAGAINSTPADMAKWLIAQVQEGRGAGARILSPQGFALLHTRHTGNHPAMSGFGMAFFTYDYNEEPVLEHYGSLRFRSLELLLMKKKIGIFVTMGGGGAPPARVVKTKASASGTEAPEPGPVYEAVSHSGARALILEHFLGPLPFKKDSSVDVKKYAGHYRSVPRNPGAVRERELSVEDSGDGGLIIDGLGVYRPSGPDMFTLERSLPLQAGFNVSAKYVFATDDTGQVKRMLGYVNAGAFDKVATQARENSD